MDFAKRMLEKYGWNEGQGLGKNSTGIKTALKPKVKLNNFGLGHDEAKQFTDRWWEDAFNDAARNVNVKKTEDGLKMEIVDEEAVQVSAIKRSRIKRDKDKFSSFIKRETLTTEGFKLENESFPEPQKLPVALTTILSDEELFKACGGLTAHKGARHGLTLSGKLKRVQEQEEALLKALQQNHSKESKDMVGQEIREERRVLESEPSEKYKSKKKKKSKTESVCDELAETCVNETREKKKKRKSECEHLEESELSNGGECENNKAKKSKKKRKHEMSESFPEDAAETSLNHGEDESKSECQYLEKSKLSNGVECENKKSKKSKKRRKHEMSESFPEDAAETSVNHGEDEAAENIKIKKGKNGYKEELDQQDKLYLNPEKKPKKKKSRETES